MFGAAAINLEIPHIPGNWFDGVVLVLLIIGIIRGRKRGMSEELLSLLQVLAIVVVCGQFYLPLGKFFAVMAGVTLVYANVFVYVVMLVLIVLLFSIIRRVVGEKLVGSDLFGRMEYYLGMLAGTVRYFCFVLIAMALLNAPYYSPEEMKAARTRQLASLGSDFFPSSFGEIQFAMIHDSLTGDLVRQHLSTVLIDPQASAPPPAPRKELPKERKERQLYDPK